MANQTVKYAFWEEYKKFSKKKKKTSRELRVEKTYFLTKKQTLNIIYQNIDFLTLKIKEKKEIHFELESKLQHVTLDSEIKSWAYTNTTFDNKPLLFQENISIKLFDYFLITFSWYAFNNQKKIYSIYDYDLNKIWQITLLNEIAIRWNNNVINSLELKGLFFKSYKNYLNQFLEYFWFSLTDTEVVKRLDYCIDVEWVEVFELQEYLQNKHKKIKSEIIESLTWLEKREYLKWIIKKIKLWRQETFINLPWSRQDLKIYDKVLDLLQDRMLRRKVKWVNPYLDYYKSKTPITRIELKKKPDSFRDLDKSWLKDLWYILDNANSYFYDSLKKYFEVDFSLITNEEIKTIDRTKNTLAQEKKEENLKHSLNMAKAYLEKLELLLWKKWLFKFIIELYPDFENTNLLDLVSKKEIENFFLFDESFESYMNNYFSNLRENELTQKQTTLT